jgi:hypothetical protein
MAVLVNFVMFGRLAVAATYDESVLGDLSSDPASPTPFTLALGTNSILGTVGSGAGADSFDAVSITVPAEMSLVAFVNSVYFGSDNQDFIGFHSGASFAGSPFTSSNYMGLAHFGTSATNAGVGNPPGAPTSTVGLDLLPVMNSEGLAVGASGFASPLGPGTYTFVIGELTVDQNEFPTYRFDVSVVPEPPRPVAGGHGSCMHRPSRSPNSPPKKKSLGNATVSEMSDSIGASSYPSQHHLVGTFHVLFVRLAHFLGKQQRCDFDAAKRRSTALDKKSAVSARYDLQTP